jgi:glucose-6-phosphate-specific signal transduction histidine kinase
MDMIFWIVGLLLGVGIGRSTATPKLTKNDEKSQEEIRRLHEDIVYYKKLTQNLVEENKQLKNLND